MCASYGLNYQSVAIKTPSTSWQLRGLFVVAVHRGNGYLVRPGLLAGFAVGIVNRAEPDIGGRSRVDCMLGLLRLLGCGVDG